MSYPEAGGGPKPPRRGGPPASPGGGPPPPPPPVPEKGGHRGGAGARGGQLPAWSPRPAPTRRRPDSARANLGRLGRPPIRVRRVSQLASEPDLAERCQRPLTAAERDAARCRGECQRHGEVGAGLVDPHAARNRHEHVA